MQEWLQNFTYHIGLMFERFLISIAIILFLMLGAIAIKLIQLNRRDMAEILKNE